MLFPSVGGYHYKQERKLTLPSRSFRGTPNFGKPKFVLPCSYNY